ncbi:unnamed protein product [Rotaria socialis]
MTLANQPPPKTSFDIEQEKLNHIQFVNVTELQFGFCYRRSTHLPVTKFTDRDEKRAKIFAHLISMPVQLKYLIVENFQRLLYVIEHTCDHLRKNALNTVQYAEFNISSCNFGRNEAIHTGKHLVPLLSTYMPKLQTLRL